MGSKSMQADPVAHLVRDLRLAIRSGQYSLRSRLPSERALAKQYRTTLHSVRKAMDLLQAEGVVRRIERAGTFVSMSAADEAGGVRHGLSCINIIEHRWPFPPWMEFVRLDHLMGYTAALEGSNVKLRFLPCPVDGDEFENVLSPGLPGNAQGCILVNTAPAALLHWLRSRGVPFVVQHFYRYDGRNLPEHHAVFVNRDGAAFKAVDHLVRLGHTRIGFIGACKDAASPTPIVMFEGFKAGLIAAGLEVIPDALLNVAADVPEAVERDVYEFLRRPGRPTGVVCQSDATAIAVLKAAKRLGIVVPLQLSVVGFNDQPEALTADPPLTTLSNPRRLLASGAVEMLLGAAAGKFKTYQTRILECELVQRQSTGPCQVS